MRRSHALVALGVGAAALVHAGTAIGWATRCVFATGYGVRTLRCGAVDPALGPGVLAAALLAVGAIAAVGPTWRTLAAGGTALGLGTLVLAGRWVLAALWHPPRPILLHRTVAVSLDPGVAVSAVGATVLVLAAGLVRTAWRERHIPALSASQCVPPTGPVGKQS